MEKNIPIILILIILFILLIIRFLKKTPKEKLDKIDKKVTGSGQYGSAKFLNQKEIEEQFIVEKMDAYQQKGIIIHYDDNNKYIDTSDKNLILTAPPGAGKSEFYDNNLWHNLQCHKNKKDSYNIITIDMKGEQTSKFYRLYKEAGWDVSVINFRDVFNSDGFNPMQQLNKSMEKALKYKNNSYKDYIVAFSEADEQANLIAKTMVASTQSTSTSSASEYFESSAESLLTSIILLIGELGCDKEKHLASVFHVLHEASEMKQYGFSDVSKSRLIEILDELEKEVKDHRSIYYASPTLNADIKTTLNIFSSTIVKTMSYISEKTQILLTKNNPILDLENQINKPTIIFLILPDESDVFDVFAAMLINYTFQELTKISRRMNKKLPREWLILEDEAGNFPPVKGKEKTITAIRSAGVRVVSAFQNVHQVEKLYGKNKAEIIKASYQMSLTAAPSPLDTASKEDIVKRLGKQTILAGSTTTGTSKNHDQFFHSTSDSTSYQMIGRELMTQDELTNLKIGEWIFEKVGLGGTLLAKQIILDPKYGVKKEDFTINNTVEKYEKATIERLVRRTKKPFKTNKYDNEIEWFDSDLSILFEDGIVV
ncbi:MAG: type IV secretory system conjugative DNA transfer family protein [Mycoplasmatales bacterium]